MAKKPQQEQTSVYFRKQARRFLIERMHEIKEHPGKNPSRKELYAFARKHEELLPFEVRECVWYQTPKVFLLELGKILPGHIPRYSERNLTKAQQALKREQRKGRTWMKKFKAGELDTRGRVKDQFYRSPEWKHLRYEILKKHGRRCMVCGASPSDGSTVLHVDHIKPRSRHPELELDIDNLQVLCENCNVGKLDRDEIDWRA